MSHRMNSIRTRSTSRVRAAAGPQTPTWLPQANGRLFFGLVAAAALLLSGCSAAPRGATHESWVEYLDATRRLQAEGPALEPGSEAERRAIERFQDLLSDFKAPDLQSRVPEVYADDVLFNDTLVTLRGADAVKRHLVETAAALDSGTVEFVDLVSGNGDYYFRWLMRLRFNELDRGRDHLSVGMTHVRFDSAGKVRLHQDFWDSTGGLFEHTPVLGWMLRKAKARVTPRSPAG